MNQRIKNYLMLTALFCLVSSICFADVVATPTLTPPGGTYPSGFVVYISCATPGATIYFTIDGSEPTENSPGRVSPYGGTVGFGVSSSSTYKAKAYKTGMTPSAVKTASFIITQVDTPKFTLGDYRLTSPTNATITCDTPGAVIHYTTNGSDPTESSTIIASGNTVYIDHKMTLKAKAWKTGWTPSFLMAVSYTMQVAVPIFSPDGGTYPLGQTVTVTISCPSPGAKIYYSTNGTYPFTPIANGGTVIIAANKTLKARAVRDGWNPSATKSANYYFGDFKVPTPTFSPDGGTYIFPLSVTIRCSVPDVTIRYTTDNTTPTTSSPTIVSGYTVWITTNVKNLKAIAWKTGWTTSDMKSATYYPKVYTPTFDDFPDHPITSPLIVTIRCNTPGAEIHYTTNGSDPTESSTPIANCGTVTVDRSMTIKAKAWKTGWTPSNVGSKTYTLNVATPTFYPDGNLLDAYPPNTVTIRCSTPDVTIYYTTNGNEPMQYYSTLIANGGTVTVDRNMTIKAKAWKTNWNPSAVKSADYIPYLDKPTFSPDSGTYTLPQTVTISCPTSGAVIHYTTNGDVPTESSTIIASGGTVNIAVSKTLKAKAWKPNWNPSEVKSADYVINISPTIYVTQTGAGLKNGTSWTNAYDSVATALNNAFSGQEVWVAAGTYSGPQKESVYDWYIFQLKSGVGLYGGFAGNEIARESRDWNANNTILQPDPGLGCTVVRVDDNAVADTTVIDGFTIQNGVGRCFTADLSFLLVGGGIFCGLDSSPTIAHNIIINNNANLWNYEGDGGYGGGIYIDGEGLSSPKIYGNTITNNNARASGGGIYIYSKGLSSPKIYGNTITNNTANVGGGGIYIYGDGLSSPKIYGNMITNNNTANGGGGIYCYTSAARISNNVINDNIAWNGAGLVLGNSPDAKIVNNTFIRNNDGGQGGTSDAINTYGSTGALIANNIITQNNTGIYASDDAPTLKNNCVYLNGGGSDRNYYVDEGGETLNHGLDINVDPKVILDNIHIQGNSPCIDVGDDDAVLPYDRDIDDEDRQQDCTALPVSPPPGPSLVDIGADESLPDSNTGKGTVYYELVRTADPPFVTLPGSSVVTAHVLNPVTGGPVSNYPVQIVSIVGATTWGWEPGYDGSSCTDANGNLKFWVTRTTVGPVTVTCRIDMQHQLSVTREVTIWFYDPSNPGSDWPMFHNNNSLTGVSNDLVSSSLSKAWSLTLDGGGSGTHSSSPVVAYGWVYVGTSAGTLYKIPVSGNAGQVTSVNLGAPIYGAPCVSGNYVYVATGNTYSSGSVYKLNTSNLSQVWRYDGGGTGFAGSPNVWNGAVYVGHGNEILTINDSNGIIRGSALTQYSVDYVTPGIDPWFNNSAWGHQLGRVYVCDISCWVTAAYCDTGGKIWEACWDGYESMYASPVIFNGYIYVGSTKNREYKIQDNTTNNPPHSALSFGGGVNSTPAAYDNKIYFGCNDGKVYCANTDATNYNPSWSCDLASGVISSSPALSTTTGMLFVGTEGGKMYGLDTATHGIDWTFDIRADLGNTNAVIKSSPAIAANSLFIVATDGSHSYLYRFTQ